MMGLGGLGSGTCADSIRRTDEADVPYLISFYACSTKHFSDDRSTHKPPSYVVVEHIQTELLAPPLFYSKTKLVGVVYPTTHNFITCSGAVNANLGICWRKWSVIVLYCR